jgi:hypothetical protein
MTWAKKTGFVLLLLSLSAFSGAQEKGLSGNEIFWGGLGRAPSWGRPFWADMNSSLIRAEFAVATNSPDYDWAGSGESYRPYIFANLGADLPVWSGDFSGGKFGFTLTLPFMIDVWLDMFERTTAPVINTSYRFGAFEIGFIHRLENPLPILDWENMPEFLRFILYNYSVRLSPVKHESTHIGDELTIHRKDQSMSITRINVSYNYTELALTVNDPDNQPRLNHGFRFGVLVLHNFVKGWYDILPQEAEPGIVEPSQLPFEFYGQYQFQSAPFYRGLQLIASAEIRLRERYKYPFSYSGRLDEFLDKNPYLLEIWQSRSLTFCGNFFAGIRYNNPRPSYFSKIGLGLRYYYGINPYGQFRSLPSYDQWGLALIFE